MGTHINEPIHIAVVFSHGAVKPAWFLWQGRRHDVREVTMRWQTRDGRDPILHLGVTDGANDFELTLNQQTLTWRVVSVAGDGCE